MMGKKFKIRKDDLVEIIAGKDKGKRGNVIRVLRDKDRVIVSGANLVKKAMKKKSQQDRGGIAEVEAPLHISNLTLLQLEFGKLKILNQELNTKGLLTLKEKLKPLKQWLKLKLKENLQ